MLKSDLCDYSDAYKLVKETIAVTGPGLNLAARLTDERNKQVIFENCAPFTNCISKVYNTQTDHARVIDVMIPKYISIEFSDNYSKTQGSVWQYYRDGPNGDITGSKPFQLKAKITESSPAASNKKIMSEQYH